MSAGEATPEECWTALVEAQGEAASIAELLPEVLAELGRVVRAEPRPSVVDVALLVGDAKRLTQLTRELVDTLVVNVRGIDPQRLAAG